MLRDVARITGRNPLSVLRGARNFVLTVQDPTRSDIRQGVNALVYEALREAPPERAERLARESPALVRLFEEGYDPAVDLEALRTLPEGSLGRSYASFVRENRIDPLGDLLALRRPTNLLEYFFRRAYKLHDVMHVALGCDASILGEVRIVSYSLGQGREEAGRAPALALAVLFLHLALKRRHEMRQAVALAHEWMRKGEAAPPHVAIRFEELWERPVEEVRSLVLSGA